MPGSRRKRPGPSYEDGKFRDPKIIDLQDPRYSPDDLKKVVRKAAKEQREKS